MLLRNFTGALTDARFVASLTICTCLSVASCGQKGELYLPAKSPSQATQADHKNAKSAFIFGSSTHKSPASAPAATVPAASEPASTPVPTQHVTGENVTGGSAS